MIPAKGTPAKGTPAHSRVKEADVKVKSTPKKKKELSDDGE